jgi:hypothetical protein
MIRTQVIPVVSSSMITSAWLTIEITVAVSRGSRAVTFVPAASAASPFYLVKNGNSLMCMSAEGGCSREVGAAVVPWTWTGMSDQTWGFARCRYRSWSRRRVR